MISPLQLEGHHLLEVELQVHARYTPVEQDEPSNLILQTRGETLEVAGEEATPYIRINAETRFVLRVREEDTQAAQVLLVLEINRQEEDEESTPYSLRFVIGGLVRGYDFPEDEEERQMALRIVRANGAGLLYGVARQLAHTLTLQTGRPGLMLPSLRFQTVIEHEAQLELRNEGEDVSDVEA